jgi:hypothetical protein
LTFPHPGLYWIYGNKDDDDDDDDDDDNAIGICRKHFELSKWLQDSCMYRCDFALRDKSQTQCELLYYKEEEWCLLGCYTVWLL